MARIVRLNEDYLINFDDHYLYFKGEKKEELTKRPLDVLEYLCSYPNCYKKVKDINNYLDEGCLSEGTIRGYIHKLRNCNDIMKGLITNKFGSGYMYTGNKIEETELPAGEESDDISEYSLVDFLQNVNRLEVGFLNAIMYCSCKWGAHTFDEMQQNANTCEGIMALMASGQSDKYIDTIDDAFEYLKQEIADRGLKSKSLDEETVVPTSMYLYLHQKYYDEGNEKIDSIANKLWEARSDNGWGIYVKKMLKHANIGCTYWAIIGLNECKNVSEETFQKYLRSLFKYENAYTYGTTIDVVNPKVPALYATSMMYILYNLLSDSSKSSIGKRYDPEKALDYIIHNFDNPFYLSEEEGINGVAVAGKTSVHTVSWSHMTINYSLSALSIAISNGYLESSKIKDLLKRIEKVVIDNSEKNEGRIYWTAPGMTLEKENRGKMIFPTMHLVVGMSRVKDSVEWIIKNNKDK